MEDERDAEDAIRGLDRIEFGRKGRRLRVEWTKQERNVTKPEPSRRSSNSRPTKTLFVINFDPYNTRPRDLERHFDPYGKILNVRIRKNFGFVQFESQEDATKALDATNMSKLMDRVISVEYAMKDDDERRSPDRGRDRSPRRRSPSPYRRQRGSPDYGRGGRGRSPSPYGRERASPDYGRGPSPIGRERNSDNNPSPNRNGKDRNSKYGRGSSLSPRRERRSSPKERGSPNDYHHRRPSPTSPRRERDISPEDYRGGKISPNSKPELRDSPDGYGPIPERRRSQSPVARERSESRSRSLSPA